MAPAVIAWKRQSQEQGPSAAALGLGALGAGALGLGLWHAFNGPPQPPAPAAPAQAPTSTPPIAVGATPATAASSWAGDQSVRTGNRFRPVPRPQPVRGGSLGGIDKKGSDIQRSLGAYGYQEDRNLYAHPVIGPLVDQQRWDEARQAVDAHLFGTEQGTDWAHRAIDRLAGGDNDFAAVGEGFVETDRSGVGRSKLVIQHRKDDGSGFEALDPNKVPANYTILVQEVDRNGNSTGVERAFSNGSNGPTSRQWLPLSPAEYTRRLKSRAADAEKPLSRDQDTTGKGRYESGTNLDARDEGAASRITSYEGAKDPYAPLPPYTGPVKAVTASDPMGQQEGVETLPAPKGARSLIAKPRIIGTNAVINAGEVRGAGNAVISQDLGRSSRIYTVPVARPGGPQRVTGQDVDYQPVRMRTVADLPPHLADSFMEIRVRGESGKPEVRYARVSELAAGVPVSPGTEFYKSVDAIPQPGRLPAQRPDPAFAVDNRGQLHEFLEETPYPQATRDAYASNIPSESHDYNIGKLQYNLIDPKPIEDAVTPGVTGNKMWSFKKDFWRQNPDSEGQKINNYKIIGAATIVANAVRGRELADPAYKGPGQRGLAALAHAALRIVTPKGQEPPLDQLSAVVNRAGKWIEAGDHRQGDTEPLPLTIKAADLEWEGTIQATDGGPGPDGQAALSRPKPGIGSMPVTVNDTPYGLHFELGTSPQHKAAQVVRGLLATPGPITPQTAAMVRQVRKHFGVSWQQIDEALTNQAAAKANSGLAIDPAEHRAKLKAVAAYGVGGHSASSFAAKPRSAFEAAALEAMDDEEVRSLDSDWKKHWLDQLVSGLAEAPRLKEAALREAARTGNPADVQAVASSWARMVPTLAETLSDELDGLDIYDRYSLVAEGITRAAHDFPAAIEAAKASSDPVVARLGERAGGAGVPGAFSFEHFAREYVGNFAAMGGIAAKTDGTNPAPLRMGEQATGLLLAQARSRGVSVTKVINETLAGASTPGAALIKLRALTKGAGGGLSDLLGFGGPKNEPHVNGSALARWFQLNPTTGSAMDQALHGEGKELGFNRRSQTPFTFNNTGSSSAAYPFRLMFSTKAAEGRGFNEGSLLQGTVEGLRRPVTRTHGSTSKTPGAIDTVASQFEPLSGGIVDQWKELKSRRLGMARSGVPLNDPRIKAIDARMGQLAAAEAEATSRPNAMAIAGGLLNMDVNRAQHRESDGSGGLVIDFDERNQLRAQPMEAFRGKASSLEQLQEQSGDRAQAMAMASLEQQNEWGRNAELAEGAAMERSDADVALPEQADEAIKAAQFLEGEIERLEKTLPDLQQQSPDSPKIQQFTTELNQRREQLGQVQQAIKLTRQQYVQRPGTKAIEGIPAEEGEVGTSTFKPLAEITAGLPKKQGAVLFREAFSAVPPEKQAAVTELFEGPSNQFGTRDVTWVSPEQLQQGQQLDSLRLRASRLKRQANEERIVQARARRQAAEPSQLSLPLPPGRPGGNLRVNSPDAYTPREAPPATVAPAQTPGVAGERKPVPSGSAGKGAMAITKAQERRALHTHLADHITKVAQLGEGNVAPYRSPSTALLERLHAQIEKRQAAMAPASARPTNVTEESRREAEQRQWANAKGRAAPIAAAPMTIRRP